MTKTAIAADAWRSIFDFIVLTADHRISVLGRLGLTPNDSRALMSLDQQTGRTMRSLAREWECDASTATWIVDRLEAKRLAERRADPADRRVKLVVLTLLGAATRDEMIAGTYTPPPEMLTLEADQLRSLREAVKYLPGPARSPATSS
jgi:MarR family transcriptional regulator, organic hydroperoxide resistance regulator